MKNTAKMPYAVSGNLARNIAMLYPVIMGHDCITAEKATSHYEKIRL